MTKNERKTGKKRNHEGQKEENERRKDRAKQSRRERRQHGKDRKNKKGTEKKELICREGRKRQREINWAMIERNKGG